MGFSKSQIRAARYWFEQVPYTHFVGSLAVNDTNIFIIDDVANSGADRPLAILNRIASTQSSDVSVVPTYMAGRDSYATTAFPTALQPIMASDNEGLRALHRFQLDINNNTQNPVSDFQLNYSVSLKQLSVAEKIFYGIALLPEEVKLRDQFHLLTNGGMRPLSLAESLKRAFMGQIITEQVYTTVTNSNAGNFVTLTPSAGEIQVITSIASSATKGNLVMISGDRDGDENYLEVYADNMSLDTPFPMWMPYQSYLTLGISAQTPTNNVPIRMTILRIKKTNVIRTLFGELSKNELTKEGQTLFDQIRAGVAI